MVDSFEKYERDGKVAVIYSPGYGAGWSTWNSDYPGLLWDREIVALLIEDREDDARILAREKYPEAYLGAAKLKLFWLDKGTLFRVEEYDGNESIEIYSPDYWLVA